VNSVSMDGNGASRDKRVPSDAAILPMHRVAHLTRT
jgi:hypothetical protein